MCHISHIAQIFDYNWCLCKQRFKLKVDDCTQLNLSSKITVYLEFYLTEGKKDFSFAEVYADENFLFGQFAKVYTREIKKFRQF